MPSTHPSSRRTATAALVILLLACIGLTACGGSSSKTSSSANAASTGSTGASSTRTSSTGTSSTGSPTTPPAGGRGPARFAAMRECLQKNGITLPARPSGAGGPRGGGFLGGGAGPTLPKGVTRAQYEAALKKCSVGRFGAGGGGFQRGNSPVFKQALSKFATCLHQNGVNVPAPNTSGNGPIFSTKGLNTSSPQFKAAAMKCRTVLTGAFRRAPSPGGAPGAVGGAPPAGGQAQGAEGSTG